MPWAKPRNGPIAPTSEPVIQGSRGTLKITSTATISPATR